jgi:O-antigen ligase
MLRWPVMFRVLVPLLALKFSVVLKGLVALLIAAPFFIPFRTYPIPSFYVEILAGACGLLIIFFALFFKRQYIFVTEFRFPVAGFFPLAFCFLTVFGLAFHDAAYLEFGLIRFGVLVISLFFIVFFFNFPSGSLDDFAELVAWVFAFSGVLAAFFALVQLYGFEGYFFGLVMSAGGRSSGSVGQANHFSSLLAISIFAIFYLVIFKQKTKILILFLPLLALGEAISGSRAAWIYYLFFVFLFFRLPEEASNKKIWGVVGVCFMIFGTIFSPYVFPEQLVLDQTAGSRLLGSFIQSAELLGDCDRSSSGSVRAAIWSEGILTIYQNPWIGVGQLNYSFQHFIMQSMENNSAFDCLDVVAVENYHNLIIQLGVEYGVLGVVFGLGLVFFVFNCVMKARDVRCIFMPGVAGIILIHAMVEYPLYYTHVVLIFALVLAMFPQKSIYFQSGGGGLRITALVVVVLGTFFCVQIFSAYRSMEALENSARSGNLKMNKLVVKELQKAGSGRFMQPYVDRLFSSMPPESFSPEIRSLVAEKAENFMKFRASVNSVRTYVNMLEASGRTEEAVFWREKAKRAYKTF